MSLSAQINRLRRKAKLLSREANIPLHQALDCVAKGEGYRSWSLLVARNPPQSAATENQARNTAPPIDKSDRAELIETANKVFESVLNRIEAQNREATRRLWNAERYVDKLLLKDRRLPFDRAYTLSLIDAFLVHHVVDLAVQAEEHAVER